jgi:parallel beta-helix repeat protein
MSLSAKAIALATITKSGQEPTFQDNTANGNQYGIYFEDATAGNNAVLGNTVIDNGAGIKVDSDGNTIRDNTARGTSLAFRSKASPTSSRATQRSTT